MSGDFSLTAKIVNPVKCIEKPWDLWISEIGHSSPQHDDDNTVFTAPAEVDSKGGVLRRLPMPLSDTSPYKPQCRGAGRARYRRAGLNRLKYHSMSLHGLFPQMDNLNAAVCHMCGVTVKCSAVYRHLLESHTYVDPIRPPPPPAPTVKLKPVPSRSRHKKEAVLPPPSIDIPVKMETSPVAVCTANAPLSRLVMPPSELQYLDEASASSGVSGEVQVCVESGELPVVSIQDTDELPLGENITDDIFAIMNSEGIQTADDITNSAEWKNIIRDIGNMQDITFSQPADSVQPQELYPSVDGASLGYSLADADLTSLQYAPAASPMLSGGLDASALNAQALKPPPAAATTPTTKSRSKSSKSKTTVREYDPNKHCGVVTANNPPCTRSLTCKTHALSLRRTVEGRIKPFDTLLAEHKASKDVRPSAAAVAAAAAAAAAAAPAPPLPPATLSTPLLVNTSIDLSAFNGLSAEQQVSDIYASLLSVEEEADPGLTSRLSSLLGQSLPPEGFLLTDEEVPVLSLASPPPAPADLLPPIPVPAPALAPPPPLVAADVCWYQSCPRPLALCTYNASHAGGAVTLGKRFATVRSNIKSSLSRSQCKATAGGSNSFYFGQNALSLSKTVHMNNASKSNKPEVRKLIVTCSATGGGVRCDGGDKEQTFGDLFSAERHTLNGHVGHAIRAPLKAKRPSPAMLDLGFVLDPLLADEKC